MEARMNVKSFKDGIAPYTIIMVSMDNLSWVKIVAYLLL